MDNTAIKTLINAFIAEVWNDLNFENISNYIHPDYTDHSLPPAFPPDKSGLIKWIKSTSESFDHQTIITDQVTEGDKSMLKIKMLCKHIGKWRNIEPTGKDIAVTGYRYYRISDNRIIEHWALVDGNAIENQLREELNGCKIQN